MEVVPPGLCCSPPRADGSACDFGEEDCFRVRPLLDPRLVALDRVREPSLDRVAVFRDIF